MGKPKAVIWTPQVKPLTQETHHVRIAIALLTIALSGGVLAGSESDAFGSTVKAWNC